jgi:hypothetical protein
VLVPVVLQQPPHSIQLRVVLQAVDMAAGNTSRARGTAMFTATSGEATAGATCRSKLLLCSQWKQQLL